MPPTPCLLPVTDAQRGFSLLEVLVSIIVLCFGLLGAVGLQASSMQASREARLQANAASLADDISELMRGNKETAIKLVSADNPYLQTATSNPADPSCGYPGKSACATSVAVAQRDIFEWKQRVSDQLPGSKVVICQDSTPYDTSGLPQWSCSGSGDIVVKIGWTRGNTLRAATGTDATDTSAANLGAFDKALRPGVIFPVSPGGV